MGGLEASLLLGGVHSVVLAVALSRRHRNRRANQYLVVLLAVMSLVMFEGVLRARGTLLTHPHLIGITAWVPFAIGPLVFLYVREMTAAEPAQLHPAWRHFVIPALYVVVLATTFWPRSAAHKLEVAAHGGGWIISAVEAVLLVYGIAYACAALVLLRRHRAHVQELYSNLRGVSLRWLLVLALLNALVWVAALVAFALRLSGWSEASMASMIVPIGSTITVFVIGYFQLAQSEIFVAAAAPAPPPSAAAPPAAAPAYARARLADDDAAALEARIKTAMTEQRLYRQPGLTLGELADAVGATPHEVSQVLSTRLARNFFTFVNEHRIEAVKTALATSDRPVLDLAFEAGFQSKSTFNTAFRKATGMTPSEYRQRATR
jgi:AraC-like DNA-binding protein